MRRMHEDHPNHNIFPGDMSGDGQAFHDRMLQKEPSARDLVTAAQRILLAADFNPREVTKRLGNEFRDWADQNKETLHPTHPYPPERNWKNIERFLKDNYPAAHKGFSMGQEQAGYMLDRPEKGKRYQTGPKTVEALGYDPKEIAAGALYLHNSSHPFRMEWSNDLDRLTKIYDKRQQMQRNYENQKSIVAQANRLLLAMPMADAYDPDAVWHDDYLSPERAESQLHPGPFYHITPWTLRPGARLEPSRVRNPEWGNYDYLSDDDYLKKQQTGLRGLSDRRQNWVWMAPREKVPYWMNLMRGLQAPLNIYEVKPEVEGPWPYNGSGSEGHVSPAATVVREIKHRKLPNGEHKIHWPEDVPQKRTAAQALGDCYQAAGRYMLDSGHLGDPDSPLRVVHGEVAGQGPMRGKTFGHAWVEVHDPDNDEPMVIDPSNGGDLHMPMSQYYSLGKINELNNYHSYTPQEAAKKMSELQHFGPWDLTVNGEAPPGRMELDEDEDDDDDWEDDDFKYSSKITAMPQPWWEMETKNKGYVKGRYYSEHNRSRDNLVKKLYGPGHTYRDLKPGDEGYNSSYVGHIIGPDGQIVDYVTHHTSVF